MRASGHACCSFRLTHCGRDKWPPLRRHSDQHPYSVDGEDPKENRRLSMEAYWCHGMQKIGIS